MSQIFILSTMQFYTKVLPSFTPANIGLKWVKPGETG